MKRRIIEALIPLTMWVLENWPRKRRPSVLALPEDGLLTKLRDRFKRFKRLPVQRWATPDIPHRRKQHQPI